MNLSNLFFSNIDTGLKKVQMGTWSLVHRKKSFDLHVESLWSWNKKRKKEKQNYRAFLSSVPPQTEKEKDRSEEQMYTQLDKNRHCPQICGSKTPLSSRKLSVNHFLIIRHKIRENHCVRFWEQISFTSYLISEVISATTNTQLMFYFCSLIRRTSNLTDKQSAQARTNTQICPLKARRQLRKLFFLFFGLLTSREDRGQIGQTEADGEEGGRKESKGREEGGQRPG